MRLATLFFAVLLCAMSLSGCYMLDKGLVGTDIGVIITNGTPLALEIIQNGAPLPTRLQPGEHLVIQITQKFWNTTDTLHVLVKARELDGAGLAGVAERTFYITHSYSPSEMRYWNNGKQSWIVQTYDLRR